MTVAKEGAAWLDSVEPGWHLHIDIQVLDMKSGTNGILGQLYGYYGRGPGGKILFCGRRGERRAIRLGFDTAEDEPYGPLTTAWIQEIQGRVA